MKSFRINYIKDGFMLTLYFIGNTLELANKIVSLEAYEILEIKAYDTI